MKAIGIILGLILVSCSTSGVEEKEKEKDVIETVEDEVTPNSSLDEPKSVIDSKDLKGGLKIEWIKHGKGSKLAPGDMIDMEYKVSLTDGTVINGTYPNGIPDSVVPFMVGYGMHLTGVDLALMEMRVGDHVELFIPSDLARGDKAIEGLIPANSDIVMRIRVADQRKPDREIDGNRVWLFHELKEETTRFSEDNQIEFHVTGFTPSNPRFVNTVQQDKPFTMRLEDQGVVPGLKKALINAKKSDILFIYVPASEAYKSKGYQDLVKPNEDIFYRVYVTDVKN